VAEQQPPRPWVTPAPQSAPPYGYPPPLAVQPSSYVTPRPPATALPAPVRIEPVPGTNFGIAYLGVPPLVAGQAIASLVAGIGSILVAFVVGCSGVAGAKDGWGLLIGGAFAILAALLGLAAIGLGLVGLRRIQRSGSGGQAQTKGRGLAVAGISCGGVGVGLTVLALLSGLLLAQ
jgi:hypothetical protein